MMYEGFLEVISRLLTHYMFSDLATCRVMSGLPSQEGLLKRKVRKRELIKRCRQLLAFGLALIPTKHAVTVTVTVRQHF